MKHAFAFIAAAVVFILARRLKRSVPEYDSYNSYRIADADGDAIPPALRPDPRLDVFTWPDTGIVYWHLRNGRYDWVIQPIIEERDDCE